MIDTAAAMPANAVPILLYVCPANTVVVRPEIDIPASQLS